MQVGALAAAFSVNIISTNLQSLDVEGLPDVTQELYRGICHQKEGVNVQPEY